MTFWDIQSSSRVQNKNNRRINRLSTLMNIIDISCTGLMSFHHYHQQYPKAGLNEGRCNTRSNMNVRSALSQRSCVDTGLRLESVRKGKSLAWRHKEWNDSLVQRGRRSEKLTYMGQILRNHKFVLCSLPKTLLVIHCPHLNILTQADNSWSPYVRSEASSWSFTVPRRTERLGNSLSTSWSFTVPRRTDAEAINFLTRNFTRCWLVLKIPSKHTHQ